MVYEVNPNTYHYLFIFLIVFFTVNTHAVSVTFGEKVGRVTEVAENLITVVAPSRYECNDNVADT